MSITGVKTWDKAINKRASPRDGDGSRVDTLARQYGGNYSSGWLSRLPASWLPYIQLARLSPPVGLFLIFFPHLFGILHAAIIQQAPLAVLLQKTALILGGSFFVSNAIHIWNDLIDAPLDALVERTHKRPIPRGAVSPFAATVFTSTQAIGAALFLPYLSPSPLQGCLYAIPSIVGWTYYPWAKRHTNFPQLVLGLCLAWGVVMGSVATGLKPFTSWKLGVEYSTLCLFLASTLWTMIYDTIYAHQDLRDDLKAGIKSLAVLYRDRTKTLLWQLLSMMTALLLVCGWLSKMRIMYYLLSAGGATISLGVMIARVDLKSAESCWWWFDKGFWFAGGSIAGGFLAEYLFWSSSESS